MTTTVDGNVSVRAIAKTFASGKTERLVYQTLAECDLPSGKVSTQNGQVFTHSTVELQTLIKALWYVLLGNLALIIQTSSQCSFLS